MESYILTVNHDTAGMRIDKFISDHAPELTRQRAQELLSTGYVSPTRDKAAKVKAGETYTITIPMTVSLVLEAEQIDIDIVYEDADLIVINKAAGMIVHPAAGIQRGTLVNALLHHCGNSLSGIGGVSRPGIVHRLDKDTSGLMLVAKHDRSHQGLSAQLQDRSLSRIYHAIVWGVTPAHSSIDAPIARCPYHRQKMAVVENGKPAVTHYRTLQQYLTIAASHSPSLPYASLVECKLQTGRTHQIRVHMNHIGHGLVGDATYGSPTNRRLSGLQHRLEEDTIHAISGFTRQALHATAISFIHPITDQRMTFNVPYPNDFQQLHEAMNG
jgi:23S rRNA pseudouridine1911/1915/1917 synthase